MGKVKIEVVGAFIDGNAPGSTIEIDEMSAVQFERIGYARIQSESPAEKAVDEKGKSVPKKSSPKKRSKQATEK